MSGRRGDQSSQGDGAGRDRRTAVGGAKGRSLEAGQRAEGRAVAVSDIRLQQ